MKRPPATSMAAHALGAQLGALMVVLGAGGVLGATGKTTGTRRPDRGTRTAAVGLVL
jgi:hypothetical protein